MFAAVILAAAVDLSIPPPPPLGPSGETWQVEFQPLRGSERSYARNGPAGPFYPDRAAQGRIAGTVNMNCIAEADGALSRCMVSHESPRDYDFGAAALRMAETKRIRLQHPEQPGTAVYVLVPFIPAR